MIVEKIHNKRLKEQGISICSKYKSNDTILERNTDKTKRNICQQIMEKIILLVQIVVTQAKKMK